MSDSPSTLHQFLGQITDRISHYGIDATLHPAHEQDSWKVVRLDNADLAKIIAGYIAPSEFDSALLPPVTSPKAGHIGFMEQPHQLVLSAEVEIEEAVHHILTRLLVQHLHYHSGISGPQFNVLVPHDGAPSTIGAMQYPNAEQAKTATRLLNQLSGKHAAFRQVGKTRDGVQSTQLPANELELITCTDMEALARLASMPEQKLNDALAELAGKTAMKNSAENSR